MTTRADDGSAAPHAVLLDFFGTLAVHGSLDDWIDTAAVRARRPEPDERAVLRDRLARVWRDARERFPEVVWDLDPGAHRRVFVGSVGRDGLDDVAEALYATMADQCAPNTGALAFVHTAHAAGVRLAVLSNTAIDVRPVLARWGAIDSFDTVTLSFEVGCVKPDPRIFRLTAEALGVDPGDCVMIGDTPSDDGAGATAAGMPCVIAPPDGMHRAFDLVARSLRR